MFLQLSYTERTIENANDLRNTLVKIKNPKTIGES